MIPRRSFLKSLIAAVALSPLLSRLIEKPEIGPPGRVEKIELWEQKPTWDGALSPNFLRKYGILRDKEAPNEIAQCWKNVSEDIGAMPPVVSSGTHPNAISSTAWEFTNANFEYTLHIRDSDGKPKSVHIEQLDPKFRTCS